MLYMYNNLNIPKQIALNLTIKYIKKERTQWRRKVELPRLEAPPFESILKNLI